MIPEFELLAHATALCDDLKGVGVVCCSGKWGMGQLGDDESGNTSRLIGALLTEMTSLFPDAVVHIGGDEAAYQSTGTVDLPTLPSPSMLPTGRSLARDSMLM